MREGAGRCRISVLTWSPVPKEKSLQGMSRCQDSRHDREASDGSRQHGLRGSHGTRKGDGVSNSV